MKILQICTKVPYPPKDGGASGIFTFSEALQKSGNSVRILAVNPTKHFINTHTSQNPFGIPVDSVSMDTSARISGILSNLLFSKLPYQAERFKNEDFAQRLVELLNDFQPDIVQIEGVYQCLYIPLIRKYSNAKIVLRCHNIEHILWKEIASETRNLLFKTYLKFQNRRLKKFEIWHFNNCDGLTAVAETDLIQIKNLSKNTPVAYIPFGFNAFNQNSIASKNVQLGFIGALDWKPNISALLWFIHNVWVNIQNQLPQFTFQIAGRNPSKSLTRKLIKFPGVNFQGELNDAALFFKENPVIVVPLFSGSGVRIKILEAMYYGCLVICSSKAIKGIPAVNCKHYINAETALEFENAIHDISTNFDNYLPLVREAQNFIIQNYSMGKNIVRLIQYYNSL